MMTGKKRLVGHRWTMLLALTAVLGGGTVAWAGAGPYSSAYGDAQNPNPFDEPVPGYVGPEGDGFIGGANVVNPGFVGWATGHDYVPASHDHVSASGINWPTYYGVPDKALGPATGDQFDVVSLGELYDPAAPPPVEHEGVLIVAVPAWIGVDDPGQITLTFDASIRNGPGADFAVFENGFVELPPNVMFAELAYVEVSTDGVSFARFPSVSLTPPLPHPPFPPEPPEDPVFGTSATLDVTKVYNLAGKHTNCAGRSWGTPFDLVELADHDLVTTGVVDLRKIEHVRIIDIPGMGHTNFVDGDERLIYDPWWTWGSGGFDLDAVGVLNEVPDFNGDDFVNADDIDLLNAAIRDASTDLRYDLNNDGVVDGDDLTTMVETCVETAVGVGTALGDFNLDGLINATDLAIMKVNYARTGVGWASGNANTDQVVNATDLAVLKTYFGFDATAGGAVPEPATLGLLAVGAAAGLARRHRRGK